MERGSTPPPGRPDDRIPRGAIAVVAVGLLATLAAALLTTGKGSGEFAHLEFVQQTRIPDSRPVAIPGSEEATMRLIEGRIQATGTNVASWSLFRVLSTLRIDAGAPVGGGHVICAVHATRSGTLIAQTHGELRATYPRSSKEGIWGQQIPETVLIEFASHNSEYAVLEVNDLKQPRWASVQGVKLEWPRYEEGTEHLKYFLPEGKPDVPIELPFYTVWRTRKPPAASVSCRVEVAAGTATAATEGSLPKMSPPIDEEAEEEAREERQEAEEGEEEPEGE